MFENKLINLELSENKMLIGKSGSTGPKELYMVIIAKHVSLYGILEIQLVLIVPLQSCLGVGTSGSGENTGKNAGG
jgi:hypothetical protein